MNYSEIISRMIEIFEYKTEKEVAELLGLKQQNFSNRKRKGTLLKELINKCVELHPRVNLHWLITGEGIKYTHDLIHNHVLENQQQFQTLNSDNQFYFQAVKEIFESNETATIEALKANISQFHEKIKDREWMKKMENKFDALQKEIENIKSLPGIQDAK